MNTYDSIGTVKKNPRSSLAIVHDLLQIYDGTLEECQSALSHTKFARGNVQIAQDLNPLRVLHLFKRMLDEVDSCSYTNLYHMFLFCFLSVQVSTCVSILWWLNYPLHVPGLWIAQPLWSAGKADHNRYTCSTCSYSSIYSFRQHAKVIIFSFFISSFLLL